ncbi:AfsR/SARP family transcriptional regulator [Streptomyces sp. CB03238]|uniref:AfsR/SARP family transcriptional regulator n=1 Tax=Streptomyces sp. CB03238 TaxID=1907777 RepID=UPI000A10D934|nr:AfsR/SARP family transcriptional regulator [Streptomyces sp. CB03238]ORT59107.1 hypothetical protein BKD26_13875 [Streptomyces sp. CB03238]
MVRLRVLGPLELVDADRAVTPQPMKIRSVLALLCVHAGTVVSRESLVEALWAGHPPRTARTALQVYVSKLRKYLDEYGGLADRLITKPHGYVLEVLSGELDLHEFDRHFRQARAATAEGRQEEALVSLHAAHALWRGGALADLRGLPTFDNLARQLDERRIEVLERRIDIQLSLGRHKSVVAELYGLVGEHPTWETAHAQLMLALYRSGRVAQALEAYRRVRDSLVRELGLEPGERLRLLHTAILARDPSLESHRVLSTAY